RGFGLLETGLDVALGRLLAALKVPLHRAWRGLLLGVLENFFFTYEVIEWVVLDLDRATCVLCVLFSVGGDGGNLVTRVKQFAADRVLVSFHRDRVADF